MSKTTFTIIDFMKKFPNDDSCIEFVFQNRYGKDEVCPKCGTIAAKFYRISTRRCYKCGECEGDIYPLAGTIMEGSNTDIVKWPNLFKVSPSHFCIKLAYLRLFR